MSALSLTQLDKNRLVFRGGMHESPTPTREVGSPDHPPFDGCPLVCHTDPCSYEADKGGDGEEPGNGQPTRTGRVPNGGEAGGRLRTWSR